MSYYKADTVRKAAEGNWLSILDSLAPSLTEAIRRAGRHVPCPCPDHGLSKVMTGSSNTAKPKKRGDGFRLFRDAHLTGGGICNTCGPRHDGFELLMWLNNYDFKDCLADVGEFLGVEKEGRTKRHSQPTPQAKVTMKNNPTGGTVRKSEGVLVSHGKAPYGHDPKNSSSYFVTLTDSSGKELTLWGVDLARAVEEAKPSQGDNLLVTNLGQQPVTVTTYIKNEAGEYVSKEIKTHKNTWVVEILNAAVQQVVDVETKAYANGGTVAVAQPAAQVEPKNNSDNDDKVVQLKTEQKPWLIEAKRRLEAEAKRREIYSAQQEARVQKLWEQSTALSHDLPEPVRLYFQNRELLFDLDAVIESNSVRFNPALPYYDEDGKEVGVFPAIISAIRDVEGNVITLHRTYLSQHGKQAKVSCSKKMMPIPDGLDVNGAAVQLGTPREGVLGVAEGMETALSAFRASKIPVWSTVNATLMESFEAPEGVHTVLIWADKDKSLTGEKSANTLKSRLEEKGIRVFVLMPQPKIPARAKSVDWNDVLVQVGTYGFPNPVRLRQQLGLVGF